ncbi:MAG: AMP-binding protein [Longispora sp.]|nr:AMP-binding protein [Longispora sp. (in: high G+C Gram-positive bacteria)]
MSDRPLLPVVTSDPGELLTALTVALRGEGPALLVLPEGPEGERLRAAARLDDPVDADTAVVIATSGSSGIPKFTELTAAALTYSARATHEWLGGPGRWVLALPSSRVAGLQILVRSIVGGSDPLLALPFTADSFAAASPPGQGMSPRDEGMRSYTSLVPTQLLRLLDAGVSLSGYDAILVGGAGIAPALLERARAAGARIVRTYGMTETCGGCVYDGEALPGVDIDIDVDGQIRIAGPMLARGYRGRDSSAFVDGWFRTDDLGRWRDDGRLEVLGRADDVIVTGGVKVPPAVVEAALSAHPRVREVVVAGRPDPEWGQRVVAFVLPVNPAAPPTLAELREFVAGAVGKAEMPRELVILEELPVLPSGKVDRSALGN